MTCTAELPLGVLFHCVFFALQFYRLNPSTHSTSRSEALGTMKRILIAASVALVTASGAQAADLAARPYTKAPPAVAAVYDWTGFYVGGNVGYGWGGNTDPSLSLVNPGNAGNLTTFLTTGFPGFSSGNQFPNLNPDGVFGGLQTGYDRQFGTWVLGVVADIQGADFSARRSVLTALAPPMRLKACLQKSPGSGRSAAKPALRWATG